MKPQRETPFQWKARKEAERDERAQRDATSDVYINRPKLTGGASTQDGTTDSTEDK